jgi:uncharacterized membrane protein YjjB (DUF3815 family)
MIGVLCSFVGSFCAGILFNIKGFKMFWMGLSGAVGWLVYLLVMYLTSQSVMAIFVGAVAVGIFSESAARLLKSPATIFSIPGIFPIVPGIAAYETIQLLVTGELEAAGGKILETLTGAGAIAFGIMLVTALYRIIFKRIRR